MILEILLIVTLFLWFLSLVPLPQHPYPWASPWLAWIAAVLITLFLFMPQIR
jgi:hypothetical protein